MSSCVNCGHSLPEGTTVCPECGTAVTGATAKKPNIALAVLSLIIPIVGCVLFFRKRKDEPKAANIYGVMALIGLAIGVIVAIIGGGNDTPKAEVYSGESPVVYGTFDDSVYQNEYFGFQWALPEGWRFESYDEVVGTSKDAYSYEDSGIPFDQGTDWKYYYDVQMDNESTFSKIQIVEFPKDDDFPDEASVLDYYADTKQTKSTVVGRTKEYYTTKEGGCDFLTCNVQYDLVSYHLHSGFFVTEKDGWYILINVMLTNLDGGTPADYIEQLQPMNQ